METKDNDASTNEATKQVENLGSYKDLDASKLITAITEFIPTFFSSSGTVVKENLNKKKSNVFETLVQSENFFKDHPNSFLSDETKNTYVVNRLNGLAKKWGLSLLVDGTLNTLKYSKFKELLLNNFDSGNDRKQKYVLMNKLWNLRQRELGKVAEFTIEFRQLAARLGWPDEVLIDIIGKGLMDKVREEYDKIDKPKTLFEATNIIINIDKKCYIESCIKNHDEQEYKKKSFRRRRYELTKTENKIHSFKDKRNKDHFKTKKDILSANYTPNKTVSMISTFLILINGKSLKTNFLIDSGSAKSFICKNFISVNKVPTLGLTSPINIQLPNSKSMTIRQTTRPLKIKIMDHIETFEFLVGNLQLHGISGILGRDWLSLHNPYINYKTNKIYFLERYCISHCPSAKGNKFIYHSPDVTAPMIEQPPEDTIIPSSISEDELYEFDIYAAMATSTKKEHNKYDSIINKFYHGLSKIFEKREADRLPPHRMYDISIDLIPGSQLYFGPIYSLTVTELKALKEYIEENIRKGFIRKSKSPAGAPILFVKKHDGTLRLCVDYRRLNAITIRNSYPLPRINDLIEVFKNCKIFTRLDLRSAYNLVRVKEGHEYLTAFRTPIGHFEYLVMFYRRFIKNFAEIMEPLRKLLKKNTKFVWDNLAEESFNNLKKSFLSNEILIFPDHEKEFTVETDASNFAVGCVLSQVSSHDNLLHPVAFYSRSLSNAEINYTIYDKELLAIITAFDVWRHHLEGAKYPVQVITDHKNLLYLKKPQHLNQRQIRWSLFLSKFDYRIAYRPGIRSGKPDSLSRRPDYQKDSVKLTNTTNNLNVICCSTINNINNLIEYQKADEFCKNTLKNLKENSNNIKSSLFSLIQGVLHFQGRIIVPSPLRAKLLKSFHDNPIHGHQGIHKTVEKLKRYYWWPTLRKDVENYILSCDVCGRCKTRRHKPYGKLQPLPIPNKPWEIIGVDFIVYLPNSQDCTCIMVISDHLTKMIHLIPCSDVPSADLTAKLLLFNIFKYHGFPKFIISDHGSQFSSEFWTSLCSALHIQPNLATAHHQQSNGQIERANAVVEQYLRCYCSTAQSEWCYFLPLCEFAYNNSLHQSIGVSPFYANYGFHPNCIIDSPPILLKDNASVLTRDWSAHFQSLQKHLLKAKEDFKKYSDNKKSSGPNFEVNDMVWLKRHYFTNEPAKKLASQYLGPFRIIDKLKRSNYRLELPSNLHLHPIFHISQLEPYTKRNAELKESFNE